MTGFPILSMTAAVLCPDTTSDITPEMHIAFPQSRSKSVHFTYISFKNSCFASTDHVLIQLSVTCLFSHV